MPNLDGTELARSGRIRPAVPGGDPPSERFVNHSCAGAAVELCAELTLNEARQCDEPKLKPR